MSFSPSSREGGVKAPFRQQVDSIIELADLRLEVRSLAAAAEAWQGVQVAQPAPDVSRVDVQLKEPTSPMAACRSAVDNSHDALRGELGLHDERTATL